VQKPVVEPPQEVRTGSNLVDQGRDGSATDLLTTGRDDPGLAFGLVRGATVKACGVAVDKPAGEKLGADPVERHMVNVGTVVGPPTWRSFSVVSGKAHRLLMARRRGGGSVVVRVRESRSHGEGTQRDRKESAGTSGGRR
jgi:hypothetical protein